MANSMFNRLFSNSSDSAKGNLNKTVGGLGLWTTAGLFSIAIYAVSRLEVGRWYVHSAKNALEIFGYGALLGIASMAVGGLFGFLFGIPRTIQAEDKSKDTDYRQAVNTNLEQISDWLTKILVGVGLTQLNSLPTKLWALADRLKPGLNDNQAITICIVLDFLVCGFFAGYLLTRLFLAGAFSAADRGAGLLIKAAHKKAIDTLEIELQGITASTPKAQKRDTYEKLTYNYLYQDPPDGFSKVIELGKKYVTDEPGTPSPKIWGNLAFAYGQQYDWEFKHGKRKDVLETAKNDALQAIKEALKLEPRMLSLFQMMWDPDDPTKDSSEENDLEVFYGEKDFKDILAAKA